MGVSIKFIGNPREFAAEVKKDFGHLRAGISSGLGEFMSKALDQIAVEGFVHVRTESVQTSAPKRNAKGQIIAPGNRERKSFLYPADPRMDVMSKDRRVEFKPTAKQPFGRIVVFPGRKIFAAGRIVSRRGRLPRDLAGMQMKFSVQSDSGIVARFSNGKSVINVYKHEGGYQADFIPNQRNMLAWLGFEYGTGVAGSMTVMLEDGTTTTLKGKPGQRRIIHKGLVQGMKIWNKAAQGKLESYMKRKSRSAK